MPQIHRIERDSNFRKSGDEWESGYWIVSDDTAMKLVGRAIYFHENQDKPSYFGGDITGYHTQETGVHEGKIVFHLKATSAHKNERAGRDDWGNEKKIVW